MIGARPLQETEVTQSLHLQVLRFFFGSAILSRKKVERVGSCHPARSCRDNSVLEWLSFPGLHIGPRIGATRTMSGVVRVGLAHIAPIAAMLAHISARGNGA